MSWRTFPYTVTSPPIVTTSPSKSPFTTTLQPKQLIDPLYGLCSIVIERRNEFISCAEVAAANASATSATKPSKQPMPVPVSLVPEFGLFEPGTKRIELPRRLERKPRPNVEQTKNFSNHVQRITCGTPPVRWIKGIGHGRSHNNLTAPTLNAVPERMNAACMRFRGDDDHTRPIHAFQRIGDHVYLIGRVHNCWRKDPNRILRNALMNKHAAAVFFFAIERNPQRLHHLPRMRGLRDPNFRCDAGAVNFRCLQGAIRHRTGQHHNRGRFPQRIFAHQPMAYPKENQHGNAQQENGRDNSRSRCATFAKLCSLVAHEYLISSLRMVACDSRVVNPRCQR